MRQHVVPGTIAAVVAAVVAAAVPIVHLPTGTVQVVRSGSDPRAWPALPPEQRNALAAALRGLDPRPDLLVLCNDATCVDLAHDIDDAAEDAGVGSALDRSVGPLGYGLGVVAESQPAADAVLAALEVGGMRGAVASTQAHTDGRVLVVIGKHPRGERQQ